MHIRIMHHKVLVTAGCTIGNQCWQCQQPCDNQQSLARSGTSSCELMGCLLSRWRKLEGSDPSAYEMIQKVQTLQKRLIAKTEEVVEADLLIQEKEKLYVELKNILARQPGPEVAEQLSIYQVHLNGLHNPTLHAISKYSMLCACMKATCSGCILACLKCLVCHSVEIIVMHPMVVQY